MSKKVYKMCDFCEAPIPQERPDSYTKKVILRKQERAIAEQTYNELLVTEEIDLCNSCCIHLLAVLLDDYQNTAENPELANILKSFGLHFSSQA